MNLDTALRYEPIVREIEGSEYKKYPVLEVGSGTNGISDFYKGVVYGVDNDFSRTQANKNPNINLVKGSLYKIPFGENSFYTVVCVDTLEHLPSEKRLLAIRELLRVTKIGGHLFLGFPTGSFSSKLERVINNSFKKVHTRDHPWIIEHIKFGLPVKEEIIKEIKQQNVQEIVVTANLNIFLWFIVHWLFTVNEGKKISKLFRLVENSIYKLAKLITLPPFYRTILVIKK